ncbi:MAG: hypothetical protein K5906_00465 [Bacilli bacterium]|nr:hypothetical protein [Bacilli bacterium]
MEAWEITLLVIGITLAIMILFIITDVTFILSFRSIFKKHNAALGLMLHVKYDNTKKLIDCLNKNQVTVPYRYIEVVNRIKTESFSNQESSDCLQAREDLTYLRNELVLLTNSSENLAKNMELKRAKDAIVEMDANYRKLIAMYNADVLGYNYWINFLPTKYIKYIFKLKEKQIIS